MIGAVTVRLAQGVIFGLVFLSAGEAELAAGLQLIPPTRLTVLSILLLVAGVKKVRKVDDGEDDEPKWMSRLSDLTVLKAVGGGALLMLVAVKPVSYTHLDVYKRQDNADWADFRGLDQRKSAESASSAFHSEPH